MGKGSNTTRPTAVMNRNGWVKIHRKLLDSPTWRNPKLARFWTWCLLKATHTDHTAIVGYQQIPLKPGQFISGRKQAAKETGLSEKSIRTCITGLKAAGKLAVKTASKYSVLTVCNWARYQTEQNPKGQPSGQQRANKGPHTRRVKNVKKDEEATTGGNGTPGFERFWNLWPEHRRKAAKEKCREVWKRKGLKSRTEHILAVVEASKASDDWTKRGGQYIPAPLVWLNGDRWDCDIANIQGQGGDSALGLAPFREPTQQDLDVAFNEKGQAP